MRERLLNLRWILTHLFWLSVGLIIPLCLFLYGMLTCGDDLPDKKIFVQGTAAALSIMVLLGLLFRRYFSACKRFKPQMMKDVGAGQMPEAGHSSEKSDKTVGASFFRQGVLQLGLMIVGTVAGTIFFLIWMETNPLPAFLNAPVIEQEYGEIIEALNTFGKNDSDSNIPGTIPTEWINENLRTRPEILNVDVDDSNARCRYTIYSREGLGTMKRESSLGYPTGPGGQMPPVSIFTTTYGGHEPMKTVHFSWQIQMGPQRLVKFKIKFEYEKLKIVLKGTP